MPGDLKQDDEATTLRGVLNMLMAIAAELPQGLDSRVEFSVCDGENLQLIGQVDADIYTSSRMARNRRHKHALFDPDSAGDVTT